MQDKGLDFEDDGKIERDDFDPDQPLASQVRPNGNQPPDDPFDDMVSQDIAGIAQAAEAAQLRLVDLVFNPDAAHLLEMSDVPSSQTERIILAEFQKRVPEILASDGEIDAMDVLMEIRHRVYRARGRKLVIDAHKFMRAEQDNSKDVEDKLWG